MSYLRRNSQTASSSGEEERDGRRGRGGWREEEEEEEEEMKPKLGKFSRRFSIPGCLGAEAARRSRGPFPREFGYSEQFLLGLHTTLKKRNNKGKQEIKKEKKDRTEKKKKEEEERKCELTAEPQPNRTIS